jgi:membrane fusion protein, heavy metal efflux system
MQVIRKAALFCPSSHAFELHHCVVSQLARPSSYLCPDMTTLPSRLRPVLLSALLTTVTWTPAQADRVTVPISTSTSTSTGTGAGASNGMLLAALDAPAPRTATVGPRGGATTAATNTTAPAAPIKAASLLDCMIQPSQIVPVGTAVPGVVESISVERGDVVKRGQVVVQLRAGVERASLAVARERATQMGETVVAKGTQELAQRELERANELFAQNFVSKTYLDKQLAEAKVAGGRTDQAGERRKLSTREVDLAQAQLALRTIRSPLSGVVVERLAAPGEYVEQKPVLRIATIDPLRVDVLVPAAAFGQVEVGQTAAVAPELFNRASVVATVKTVDRLIDAASNTFRVRLELPNPNGALPAGLRCKIDLALKLPEVERTTAGVLGVVKTSATLAAPALVSPVTPAVAPAPAPATSAAAKVPSAAASAPKNTQAPKSVKSESTIKSALSKLWRGEWEYPWRSALGNVWGSAPVRAVAPSAHAFTPKRAAHLLHLWWAN